MTPSKDRQRRLARAKLDRQLAKQARAARLRRQILAGLATAMSLLLVAGGMAHFFGAFDDEPAANTAVCGWTPLDPAANPALKDVGTPPTTGVPETGAATLDIATSYGIINATLPIASAPCAVASLRHLAAKTFYNNTTCHELTGNYLTCGDPSGTGNGGPTYSVLAENRPDPGASPAKPGEPPQYPRGTIALKRTGPASYGSQFVIVHKDITTDDPTLATVGYVTTNMYLMDRIVKAGTVDNGAGDKTRPAKPVTLAYVNVEGGLDQGLITITPPPAAPSPVTSPTR
ncbi:peptidylprolyl isomerase [Pilimelia columellifera]|uniref:Peptidylprolyl isomerase n=1 Tax=Pilimelia columellifera subsp. columellifera TaxID=706583 RepID=A0ABN3NNC4_9ACTN